MESKIEILVIDDHLDVAQTYVDSIKTHCHLQAVAMSNIELAIKCVMENPIKIVVLDQRMPIPGNEVFVKLKEVNPFLKIMMLTGEASAEEILAAETLGYSAKLHKNKIAQLPNLIYKLYAEYENGITQIIREPKLFHREWKLKLSHVGSIKYYLLDYKIIDENFIRISEWKTLDRISQGEKQNKEVVIELKITDKISVSEEYKFQLKNAIKSFLSHLDVALDSVLENSISLSKEMENTKIETSKKTAELSLREDEVIDGKKVISKNYEANQVYKQILIHIKKECSFCDEYTIFPLMIYKPINKKIYRQISYTEDNKDHIVSTGHYTW